MTDQYLCRGKRLVSNNWVYGYYVCADGKFHYILSGKFVATSSFPVFEAFEVEPETVGRCTGVHDKNGKLIFEGDILRITTVDQGDKRIVNVRFGEYRDTNYTSDGFIGWYIAIENDCVSILNGQEDGWILGDYVEVISSVHDNPELLKGEQDG